MKKIIIGFLVGVILASPFNSFAASIYRFTLSQYQIYIDGEQIDTVYSKGRVNYVSVDDVVKVLDAEVKTEGKRVDVTTLTDLEEVAAKCKDSAVMIYGRNPDGTISQGSGVVFDSFILTAKHLVEGTKGIDVFIDDSAYGVSGTVHYMDEKLDIALIKADTDLPSVTLGDSDKLVEGQKLVSITSPRNTQNVIDECVNSGIAHLSKATYLTISESSMSGGSSGGGIFTYSGNLVAIEKSGDDGSHYAILINDIKPILEKLK
jgi:S1-C subfamily serine protease